MLANVVKNWRSLILLPIEFCFIYFDFIYWYLILTPLCWNLIFKFLVFCFFSIFFFFFFFIFKLFNADKWNFLILKNFEYWPILRLGRWITFFCNFYIITVSSYYDWFYYHYQFSVIVLFHLLNIKIVICQITDSLF